MKNFIKIIIKSLKRFYILILKLFKLSSIYKKINLIEFQTPNEQSLSVYIFTKDRPMQLDLFLNSYIYFTSPIIKPIVIFNASDEEFEKAYQEVFTAHAGIITLAKNDKELGFKKTYEELIETYKTELIVNFVDDIIFKDNINWKDITKFNTNSCVPSLRLGLHLNFCYTANQSQITPPIKTFERFALFKWEEGEHDWNYPLSLDGNIFSRDIFLKMIEELNYKAPNTLELKLQKFNDTYKKKYGVCYTFSPIVNNPANIVQNEIKNIHGKIHQKDLLKEWQEGRRIDFKAFEKLSNRSCHQELEFFIK